MDLREVNRRLEFPKFNLLEIIIQLSTCKIGFKKIKKWYLNDQIYLYCSNLDQLDVHGSLHLPINIIVCLYSN